MAKILFVDDEPESLFLYETIFTKGGYEVTCLSSPIKAIEHLKSQQVDMVISDYCMPQMDGLEFYQKIRESKVYEGQLIFVTGSVELGHHTLKNRPGIIEVFQKPLSFHDLLKFLNKNIKPAVIGKRLGLKQCR